MGYIKYHGGVESFLHLPIKHSEKHTLTRHRQSQKDLRIKSGDQRYILNVPCQLNLTKFMTLVKGKLIKKQIYIVLG